MTGFCKKNTYNIKKHRGTCLSDCQHGAWNGSDGVCGAECPDCGGTLYLSNKGRVFCDGCGIQRES